MTTPDPVRALLRARGCPDWLVAGGLQALVERWAGSVRSVEVGYAFTLDDYLNDLDLRLLLQLALEAAEGSEASGEPAREPAGEPMGSGALAEVRAAVSALDERLRAATVPSRCLWGSDVEWEERHSPEREWWYYRRPAKLTEELREELDTWGLL